MWFSRALRSSAEARLIETLAAAHRMKQQQEAAISIELAKNQNVVRSQRYAGRCLTVRANLAQPIEGPYH